MAGKAIHLQRAMGKNKLRGRDAIWAAIREIKDPITLDELEIKSGIHRVTVKSYLQCLVAGGYLELKPLDTGAGRYAKRQWKLIRDIGVERPYVNKNGQEVPQAIGRNQMWRALKIMKAPFTKHDLCVQASTDEHPIHINEANYYLRFLARAGYVVLMQQGKGGKAAVYRFLPSRNTGPRAPMVQKINQVFDPNIGEVVWTQEPREED